MDDARSGFEQLVREHQGAVCAIAYAATRDRARSQELAQDAFLVAWRYRDRVAVVTAGWICAIARNLARNAARRRKEVAMDHEPAAAAPDARDVLIDHETAQRAIAALAELPEKYREAVVLFYRSEQSMQEVADALGVTEAAARQRVHRGRAKLRDALAPVVATIGATRPSSAFATTCVAVWLAGGSAEAAGALAAGVDVLPTGADALPADALPSASGAGAGATAMYWAIGGIVASAVTIFLAITPGLAARDTSTSPSSTSPISTSPSAARTRADLRAAIHARFRAPANVGPAPSGFIPLEAPEIAAATMTVDLDFSAVSVIDIVHLLAVSLDTPMWIDQSIDATVDITVKKMPALEALDEVIAQAGATRTEVAALRLVAFGGRTDAAQLGGDNVSLQMHDAALHDVLTVIESKLHMPIGRLAVPEPPRCEETAPNIRCVTGAPKDPSPHVTIDANDVPAGVVLEQVLAQLHLGYELTTGFAITPGDN